ncbi:hypothetical protein EXW39_08390 [Bacillus mycoides]|nr:hypothetical protein EXW39_08390 [Bacillus mycoides]
MLYEICTLFVIYFCSSHTYGCLVCFLIQKRASQWMLPFINGIIQSVPSAGFGFYVLSLRTI